jgi:hypothetical protein
MMSTFIQKFGHFGVLTALCLTSFAFAADPNETRAIHGDPTNGFFNAKIDFSPLNPMLIDSAINFFTKQNPVRMDARATFQFSTDSESMDILNNQETLAAFAQKHRLELKKGFVKQPLADSGAVVVLEMSVLPLILANEFSEKEVLGFVSQIAGDAAEGAVKAMVRESVRGKIPNLELSRGIERQIFRLASPVSNGLKSAVRDIAQDALKEAVHKNYGSTMIRNTFKKVYAGAFKVLNLKNEEVAVIYFKAGLNEHLIRSPLTDQMAAQAADYIAGSGTAPSISIGVMGTLDEDQTLGLEVGLFQYRQAFAQPLLEIGNQIATLDDNDAGGLSMEATLTYYNTARDLDIILSGKLLEGKPAGELRIRKGIGHKNTLYLDAAYNEKNKDWKMPSIIDGSPLQKFKPFLVEGSPVKGVIDAMDSIPNRSVQEPGSSAYLSIFFAFDRLLYSGDKGEFHYTLYASKEKGYYDLFKTGGDKMEDRQILGASISWKKDFGWTTFKAYTSIEYAKYKYVAEIPANDYSERTQPDHELSVSLVGSLEFGNKGITHRQNVEKLSAQDKANRQKVEVKIDELIALLETSGFNVEAYLQSNAKTQCLRAYLKTLYYDPKPFFNSSSEMRNNPDQLIRVIDQNIDCD